MRRRRNVCDRPALCAAARISRPCRHVRPVPRTRAGSAPLRRLPMGGDTMCVWPRRCRAVRSLSDAATAGSSGGMRRTGPSASELLLMTQRPISSSGWVRPIEISCTSAALTRAAHGLLLVVAMVPAAATEDGGSSLPVLGRVRHRHVLPSRPPSAEGRLVLQPTISGGVDGDTPACAPRRPSSGGQ
jgi:hypothetical protein